MKRWLALAVAGLGMISAGCSAPGQPPVAPGPPPPAPTKDRVAWAETVCATVKEIDGKLATLDAAGGRYYVDAWIKQLRGIKPSGVAVADGYAADLAKTLEMGKAQPGTSLAHVVPQQPKLAATAEQAEELTASYNVAPACTPVGRPVTSEPGREAVVWAGAMCRAHRELSTVRTDPLSEPGLSDPRFAQAAASTVSMYASDVRSSLNHAAELLEGAQPTGIPDADTSRATLLAAVRAASSALPRDGVELKDLARMPLDQVKAKATEVAAALVPAKLTDAEFDSVVTRNPPLGKARDLLRACEPPTGRTLPEAANGSDLSACRTGKCEVRITGSTDVTAAGTTYRVTVRASRLTVTGSNGVISVSGGGVASFGNGDSKATFELRDATGNTAIVGITAS